MKLGLHIHSSALISAQHSFDGDFPDPLFSTTSGKLQAIEPDYSPYIPAVPIRRMSRLLKMAIAAGMRALHESGIRSPAAILTGSGRASMSDTESFLSAMIQSEEGALNPTPFIQSTYNSPNGWLALLSGCTGYNTTYAHRGHSLEWALMDASMLFAEGAVNAPVLVGCYDEITPVYQLVKGKIGYWKDAPINSLELLNATDTTGSIGGEGAAGFIVSDSAAGTGWRIETLVMLQHPDIASVTDAIRKALRESDMTAGELDAAVLGMNGDSRAQPFYDAILPQFKTQSIVGFKHLCGEYDTAVSFALWLAGHAFAEGSFPDICLLRKGERKDLKTILLVNHYLLGSWSVMVLRKTKNY